MRLLPVLSGILVQKAHADETATANWPTGNAVTGETVTDDTVTSIIDICPAGKAIIEVTCHEDLAIELASMYYHFHL